MLRYFLGMAGMILFSVGTNIAQFEGVMDMKVTGSGERKDESMLYTMTVKNNLMATEIKNREKEDEVGKFIFRGDKQVIWMINDKEKSYLEISLKDDKKADRQNRKAKEFATKVKKTGNKETILGYVCEEVIIESEEEVTHIWGTQKLGDLYGTMMKSFAEMGGQEEEDRLGGWDDEIAKLAMFPLKVVSKENDKVVMTQEVTRVEQKKVPESMFNVPKDYKKQTFDFNIQNMMKQMKKKGKKEDDKNDPGENVDMEKLMKQLKDMQKDGEDTTDGGF